MDRALRALIVDDDVDTAETIGDVLRSFRFDVQVAHGAATALEAVWRLPPDVLVVDLQMPDVGGSELVATLMHLPALQDAALVFVSGAPELATGIPSHAALLRKPVAPELLLETIARLLEERRTSS